MGFLDDYEPVSDRIARFWEKYPNGRIITTIVERTETDIIIQAEIFTNREDLRPATVDFAHETIGSSQINRTSWLENASTSSIGRGLATLGFQAKKDNKTVRPSREEMQKVERAKTTQRDWITEGTRLASEGDLEALKQLANTSVKEHAPKAVTERLVTLAKELAAKTNPDSQSATSEGLLVTAPF